MSLYFFKLISSSNERLAFCVNTKVGTPESITNHLQVGEDK